MLIERRRLTGHPAIEDLELDFRDETGEPARTVVLAGSNGVGKTILLEAIHGLSEHGALHGRFDAHLQISAAEAKRLSETKPPVFGDDVRHVHVVRLNRSTLSAIVENQFGASPFGIDNSVNGLALRSFYSDANVTYIGTDLENIQAGELDRPDLASLRAGDSQGIEIPQLLLAIRQADLEEVQAFREKNPGLVIPENIGERRIARFRQAFSLMFSTKKFKGVSSENGRFRLLFEDNGVESTIQDLSTGEKQVVFRRDSFGGSSGL